jgi:hypothetical protein
MEMMKFNPTKEKETRFPNRAESPEFLRSFDPTREIPITPARKLKLMNKGMTSIVQ